MTIKRKLSVVTGMIGFIVAIVAGIMARNALLIKKQVDSVTETVGTMNRLSRLQTSFYKQTYMFQHLIIKENSELKIEFDTSGREILKGLEEIETAAGRTEEFSNADERPVPGVGGQGILETYRTFLRLTDEALRIRAGGGTLRKAVRHIELSVKTPIDDDISQKFDDLVERNSEKVEHTHHHILITLGSMPWRSDKSIHIAQAAESSIRYFLAVHRASQAINQQMEEFLDYFITGDEDCRNDYHAFGVEARVAFRELHRILKYQAQFNIEGEEADILFVNTIERKYEDVMALADMALSMKESGRNEDAWRMVEDYMWFMMNNVLLSTLDGLAYDSREEIEGTHKAMLSSVSATAACGVAVLGIGLALFILTFVRIIRGIVRPLGRLREGADRIRAGDLGLSIPINTRDELGELAGAFNNMAANLKKSHDALQRRLNFEQAIAEISSRFVGLQDIDAAISAALADIGRLSEAGRTYIFLLNDDRSGWRNAYEWCAEGVQPMSGMNEVFPVSGYPWWHGKLLNEEVINIEDVSGMPGDAKNELRELKKRGVNSVLALPVSVRGAHAGFAGFENVFSTWKWSDDDIALLRMFSEIIGSALERRNAEEKLRRYADELRESNEDLKSFAYIVSHDLRAPLVNIKGFAGELRRSLTDASASINGALRGCEESERDRISGIIYRDVPEALGFIETSVSRMDGLINAILKLSRMGRRELKPETIGMNELVQSVLGSFAHQAEEKKATITTGKLPDIIADRTAMEQIMSNLLDNAVKYLEHERPGVIGIKGDQNGDEAVFHIHDNGRGMEKEDIPKAFEVFRRIGSQDVPGEGMGLAYVKALVKRFGGRIWCESEPGKGSTFSFSIPQRSEE